MIYDTRLTPEHDDNITSSSKKVKLLREKTNRPRRGLQKKRPASILTGGKQESKVEE